MDTIILNVDLENVEESKLEQAGKIIREGGLVAFPTETVYGLGADALNEQAAAKIYAAKGRPSDNPLIVHIAEKDDLSGLVRRIPKKAAVLMDAFWPGPLTMIFEKADKVPYGTTGGLDTVAVRMPDHPVALAFIKSAHVPIAAPSANTSGRPSPTKAVHVRDDMDGKIDMIVDGGDVEIGIESTIVDMTVEPPMLLRPGYITREMLEEKIGRVTVDKVVEAKHIEEVKRPKAPGMKYKHYAPKADFIMFEGTREHVVKAIKERKRAEEVSGKKTGIICTDETKDCYDGDYVISLGSRENEETIAANLYSVLRAFDDTDVDVILGETFYGDGLGQAIMNRLIKAAGYKLCNTDDL